MTLPTVKRRRGIREFQLYRNAGWYCFTFVVALVLKSHYRVADAEALRWILMPTAYLVQLFGKIPFVFEAGTGFVNLEKNVIIAPACAGINFMIIAFCVFVFGFVHRFEDRRLKWAWCLGSFFSVYGLTLVVNAVRIFVSIYLFESALFGRWVRPDSLHRIAGTMIYFSVLYFLYQKLTLCFTGGTRTARFGQISRDMNRTPTDGNVRIGWLPVAGYLSVAVVVPLLNRGYQHQGGRFVEHCVTLLLVCLVVILMSLLLQWCFRILKSRIMDKPTNGCCTGES